MDLNLKCPLCDMNFIAQDDIQNHVQSVHNQNYDPDSGGQPLLTDDANAVESVAPATVITTEPVVSPDVATEPVMVDDVCDCLEDCFWCFTTPSAFNNYVEDFADGSCVGCGAECADFCRECSCVMM